MKKRLCMLLLGIVLFTESVLSVCAEENDEKPRTSGVSTGTQTGALEEQKDVDEDIREELNALIPDEIEEIKIGTTEEFLDFAEKCKLDTWSVNKKVILTEDISLLGVSFNGVPTFGGVFDGQGHSISDMAIKSDMSYVALFSNVQSTGVISDLNVKGTVIPAGSQIIVGGIVADNYGLLNNLTFEGVVSGDDYVGGIAGMNELTGNITNCSVTGYIKGVHFAGGVAGENMGNISKCINESAVNTTNVDTQITIDSMNTLNKVLSMIKNGESSSEEARADITTSDIGGIAGLSIGIISDCINQGLVGYEHVGYNIGGIAGRQSGYVYRCTNNAVIHGRKDVGGIVGQAEPYVTVDLSTDVAYQLNVAISELHDRVTTTLQDTKKQSNTITNRLNVIQQFTSSAIEDVRFIANETTDFANGVSGATSEAFSRVQYVMEESSKDDGLMDQTNAAIGNASDAASSLKDTVNDLGLEQYMSDPDKKKYQDAKDTLEILASQYANLSRDAGTAYYNRYVEQHRGDYGDTTDLQYSMPFGTDVSTAEKLVESYNVTGTWRHSTDDRLFPDNNSTDDKDLNSAALADAEPKADAYAKAKYRSPVDDQEGALAYTRDLNDATEQVRSLTIYYLPFMADAARGDALKAMGAIESAADNLESAGDSARGIVKNLAGRGAISFPQFSAQYKAHTTSLADNMQGMNDNFGLLNNEMNSATGVIVDDLQDIADQFNVIMNLYTDAIDGVLEMDYSNTFEDVSLEEALICTDATVDKCINYGTVYGDIDTSGIAGTMAIEYDFDAESDVTGINDSKLNTSFISKCVLRDNRNYSTSEGEKSYIGGICGLQEMGTIIGCANYGNLKSNSGEYVGGVCGSSLSYIVNSRSKGILSGASYVGGIVGDGTNIRDCVSLVDIEDTESWYGAIAGHVSDEGEVRNNFFVSDELAGIDRISYSLKAEPVSYNDNGIPYDITNLTVTYVVEDDDLEEGKEVIKKESKKFGDGLDEANYPKTNPKEGFYVTWDKPFVDSLRTDQVITATYHRFRTTISEANVGVSDDSVFQSELLVDGSFKADDKLVVERQNSFDVKNFTTIKDYDADTLKNYTTLKVTIPDDGAKEHQIRYRPNSKVVEELGEYEVYLVTADGEELLEKTGEIGDYSTYDIAGNEFTLKVRFPRAKLAVSLIKYVIIAIVIACVLLVSLIIFAIIRGGKKAPKIFRFLAKKLSKKIEDKEQIFYDDSGDDK